MNSPAIDILQLRKTYPPGKRSPAKEALKGIDLTIPRGAFFGLLGPNGAGKSTLINIMAGLVIKSSGSVSICGYDIERDMRRARLSIGVVPQELVLDTFFTVREALENHAGYYGIAKKDRRTDEIIEAMGLTDKATAAPRSLSGGMRRRLLIAKALVHNPPVLVLDEPTAGVDVELRTQLWDYVRGLNRRGTTILLTTHYLEEAEELCDEVAIINNGEVVARDNTQRLMQQFDSKQLVILFHTPPQNTAALPQKEGWTWLENGTLGIRYQPSQTNFESLLGEVKTVGGDIRDISTREADLEEVFLHLVGAGRAGT